ncbi:MAG: hypothetical protein LC746_11175 [Acidobacteria bacterium]|nr:hypothetical protein [Acidobacteriota bacterium]
MRRRTLFIAVALLTFVIGAAAATLWYLHRPIFSRAVDEDSIAEAVFRQSIKDEEQNAESSAIYCLSRDKNTDPSDELMRRFADYSNRVRKLSQCEKTGYGVTDKQTGKRGMSLEIQRLTWVSRNEAKVAILHYSWGMGQTGFGCNVIREHGSWMVKNCEWGLIT